MKYIIIVLLLIVTGVGVMAALNTNRNNLKYDRFISKDKELNIAMDYVAGWRFVESRGSYGTYAEVQFIEPKRKDKEFTAMMTVRTKDDAKADFTPATTEGMAQQYEKARMKFKDAQLLSRKQEKLHNETAVVLELSYMALDKFDMLDAKPVRVKERMVFFKKGKKFYYANYLNTIDDFTRYDKAFYHCIKSMQFKEN